MQVRNAASTCRLPVVLNASPQRWPAGANDVCDGALKVVAANPVDPLERADKPATCGRHVRGRDADDRAAGDHENHGEIGERRNSTARDLLDAAMGGAAAGRDRNHRSNLLVHGATSLGASVHKCTCKRYARRLLICRTQRRNQPPHSPKPGCADQSKASIRY
jgi:hypothetical protein